MPTNREIDRIAQNIFNNSFPPGWLIRKQDPDIFIDYFVEIDEKTEPSGVVFGVQLKGTNSPRYSKNLIKISIKTKPLSYYLDKVKQPIFLIVVDTKNRKGFWMFVQNWAKEELKKRNWREQKKINCKIPLTNSLSDLESLCEEVARAEIFMRNLRPSSISAAVQSEKKYLEGLDQRIQVDISYRGGKVAYSLIPRESFNFDIHFRKSPHVKDKFEGLLNQGRHVSFDTDEIIEIVGSPLFEKIIKRGQKGKLFIEPEKKVQTDLLFSVLDAKDQEKHVLYGIKGVMMAGKKEARFKGGLKDTPLKVDFSFLLTPPLEGNRFNVNFNFDISGWQNINVLWLPYFNKILQLFRAIQEGCFLKIVCEINGNHIFTATTKTTGINKKCVELIIRHLELFERIRTIAKEVNINPIYPKGGIISRDEIESIDLLYELIKTSEYRQKASEVKFSGQLIPNDNFSKIIKRKSQKDFSSPLILEPKNQKFRLLGKEFEFHPLRYTLTNPILMTDLSKMDCDNQKNNKEIINIQWSGGPESELIISKV